MLVMYVSSSQSKVVCTGTQLRKYVPGIKRVIRNRNGRYGKSFLTETRKRDQYQSLLLLHLVGLLGSRS
jgi:hypothetical protein